MLITILVFILILGLLIFVHEFGHFVVAKKSGMKVEEFGFGLPPRIIGKKVGETIYSLNYLPFGGFVKILGEEGGERKNPRSFGHKPFWMRLSVLTAGVMMNFLLGAFLLMLGHGAGLPTSVTLEELKAGEYKYVREIRVQIIMVAPDSPAEAAGITIGDTIKYIGYTENGEKKTIPIFSPEKLQELIGSQGGKEITVFVQRGQDLLQLSLIPRVKPPEGEGAMGISMAQTVLVSYPWYLAIWKGLESAFNVVLMIVVVFGGIIKKLVSTGVYTGEVTGPVGIFVLTSQFTKLGFLYLLQFTALISINLALINILPFPALDGGRIVFLVIEKIKGSPVSERVERTVHAAGLMLLIVLMILITFRDIIRFF